MRAGVASAAWASRTTETRRADVFVEEREPTKNETVRDRRETFFRTADGRSMLSPSSLDALAFALDASSDSGASTLPATLPGGRNQRFGNQKRDRKEMRRVGTGVVRASLRGSAQRRGTGQPAGFENRDRRFVLVGNEARSVRAGVHVTDPHHARSSSPPRRSAQRRSVRRRKTPTRGSYSRDSLDDFLSRGARRSTRALLETARVTRNVTVRDETRVLKTHKKTNSPARRFFRCKILRAKERREKKKTGEARRVLG